ncbi:MAG: hypothetical protein UV51_C0007G0007 [Candidatus Woesebacteria bacterium GW2011_GWC1_42_9]|nr:MAG: hypothetical protein UV51_C0007G0007 [Candidatus Woesebacteria bacterium GW2011_GWC1_42_9]
MKLYLCNYSDENYRANQQIQIERAVATGDFDLIIPFQREWLVTTDFYKGNRDILDRERLAGYGLWKPYICLEALKQMDEGDILLYMDCGDIPHKGIRNFVFENIGSHDFIFITTSLPQKNWTRRDTFVYMGCDSERYWNCQQMEDGVIAIRKSDHSFRFLEEWLFYCKDKRIITDERNVCGLPNLPGFVDNRFDQSIVSNLVERYKINVNNSMRQFLSINLLHHKDGIQATNGMAKWDEFGNMIK